MQRDFSSHKSLSRLSSNRVFSIFANSPYQHRQQQQQQPPHSNQNDGNKVKSFFSGYSIDCSMINYKWDVYQFVSGFELRSFYLSLFFHSILILYLVCVFLFPFIFLKLRWEKSRNRNNSKR